MGIAEFLKKSGGLLAGLSGSLAGITALLYAVGFIASKSADQTLGLEFEFASRDPVFYIRRGGLMIASVAIIVVAAAVAVIVAYGVLRRAGRRLGGLAPKASARVASWAAATAAPVSSLIMIALVVGGLAYCLEAFPKTDGLLFEASPDLDFCAVDRDAEEGRFRAFAALVGVVAGVAVVARASLFNSRQWFWASLAGFAMFLALVGIPITYGALEVEADAPRVWITPLEGDPGRMWLLSRASDGALIWLEEERKVQWIRADKIETLKFGPKESIMAAVCAAENAPTKGDRP